jgi:methionine-S-sulfoxide reductase
MTADLSSAMTDENKNKLKRAYFAGGCFWCTEHDLKHVNGVKEVISGYAGGDTINPAYEEVCGGGTGHREAVMVLYNPEEVSLRELTDAFLKTIDPHDPGGQFFDRGFQYTNAVFYLDETEKMIVLKSIENAAELLNVEKIAVEAVPYKNFFKAENYHQNFAETNPARYCSYRQGSGRDEKLKMIWNIKK